MEDFGTVKHVSGSVRTTFSVISAGCPINYFDYSTFRGIVMCHQQRGRCDIFVRVQSYSTRIVTVQLVFFFTFIH